LSRYSLISTLSDLQLSIYQPANLFSREIHPTGTIALSSFPNNIPAMRFTSTTRRTSVTQFMPSPPPVHSEPELPSREEIQDMLDIAQLDAGYRYALSPSLAGMLQFKYQQGILDCNDLNRDHVAILLIHLRGERLVLNAFNKHQLAGTAGTLIKSIPERLDSFPLRNELMRRSECKLPADVLRPIFQAPESVAAFRETSPQQRTGHSSRATREKPVPKTPVPPPPSSKGKTGRATDNYGKLDDAPVPNLDFPSGNVTLPELSAFLPNSIKSWDVIDRVIGNGATSAVIARMINGFRTMDRGKIESNSVYRMMKAPMDKRAEGDSRYVDWKPSTHNDIEKPEDWDPTSVSVSGFRTAVSGKKKGSFPGIPFKDLANGVKNKPSGLDALDLTRAVQYCEDHQDEEWTYPDDYERLVNHLGPAPVRIGHQDAAAIARYTTKKMAAGYQNSVGRKRDSRGRLQKVESEDEEDFGDLDTDSDADLVEDMDFDAMDTKGTKRKRGAFIDESDKSDDDKDNFDTLLRKPVKRTKIIPELQLPRKGAQASRSRKDLLDDNINSESDEETYQGPKEKLERLAKAPRRSGRATRVTKTYKVGEALGVDEDDEVEAQQSSSRKGSFIAQYEN
jgi:hypothetical protein